MDRRTQHCQKNHLIADVNLNPRFEVVQDLFKVSSPGSSQVAGITVRLERRKATGQQDDRKKETERQRRRDELRGVTLSAQQQQQDIWQIYQIEFCHRPSDTQHHLKG